MRRRPRFSGFFMAAMAVILTVCMAGQVFVRAAEDNVVDGKDLMILYTSDVHCGVDQGFGYAGLFRVREVLEEKGYNVILVDDGDSIQGEAIGSVTKGEAVIDLMNKVGYEIAIPGNHEFDYGVDRFLELAEKAEFPYISCNFKHDGELVFDPYLIRDFDGIKVAFVGVTTPETITTSTPSYFKDENGKFVYDFCRGENGEAIVEAVQTAVDDARAEGADYVVVMGHMGNEEEARPYTYADIIANTTGIDIFLDGHSHDTEQVVMKNKNGEDVIRSACGTKLEGIGWAKITQDGEKDAGLYTWSNSETAFNLFGINNEITQAVETELGEVEEMLGEVIGRTDVLLTINDPEAVDSNGLPVRMIRRADTNLGDLCADALRDYSGAEIALVNGGAIRKNIEKGDITLKDTIGVHPFGNLIAEVSVTGQQVLDALEWASRAVPGEIGGFMQTSGLSYEVHTYIESSCTEDENGMFTGVEGERRVRNVKVQGEPIDPEKTYTLASIDYIIVNCGDGFTMFEGSELLDGGTKTFDTVISEYIQEELGGNVSTGYEELTGDGRIVIVDDPAEAEAAETAETAASENEAEGTETEGAETEGTEAVSGEAGADNVEEDTVGAVDGKIAPPVDVRIEDGLLTTDIFKMQIPESWDGKYEIDARAIVDKDADLSEEPEGGYEEYYIDFFEKQSFEATNQQNGLLFTIAVTNEKLSEYDLTPSEYRGSMVNKDLNEIHHISVWYPSDVQWVTEAQDQYLAMFDEKEEVISSMKGRNGFSFARNPFESKDYTSGTYNANLIEYAHGEYGSSITALVSKYATLSSGDVKALNQYIGVLSDNYIIYKPIPAEQSEEILGIDLTAFLEENSPVPAYFVKSKVATKPNPSDTYGYVREVDGVYYVYPIPQDTSEQPEYCVNDYLARSTYYVTDETKFRVLDENGELKEISAEEFYGKDSSELFAMFSEIETEDGKLISLTQIR